MFFKRQTNTKRVKGFYSFWLVFSFTLGKFIDLKMQSTMSIIHRILTLLKYFTCGNFYWKCISAKKSNESKLVSYEINFSDFYFSSVKNGWLCKICCSFSNGNAGNTAFVDKPGKLGEHPSARFSDYLVPGIQIAINYPWKTSNALKKW